MTNKTISGARAVSYGDWAITLLFMILMAGAYFLTLKWPANAAFFPQLLAGTGFIMCIVQLGCLIWQARASNAQPVVERSATGTGEIALVEGDEEQGNEDEFHKVFARADARAWGECLSWIVLFFVSMYVLGLLITLPVFTVLYLRIVAKASWLTCLLYVLGTAGVMYLLFVMFLHLPLPEGILFGE